MNLWLLVVLVVFAILIVLVVLIVSAVRHVNCITFCISRGRGRETETERGRGTAFLSSLGSRITVITSEKFAVIPNHSKRALEDGPVPWFTYAIWSFWERQTYVFQRQCLCFFTQAWFFWQIIIGLPRILATIVILPNIWVQNDLFFLIQ